MVGRILFISVFLFPPFFRPYALAWLRFLSFPFFVLSSSLLIVLTLQAAVVFTRVVFCFLMFVTVREWLVVIVSVLCILFLFWTDP